MSDEDALHIFEGDLDRHRARAIHTTTKHVISDFQYFLEWVRFKTSEISDHPLNF